MGLGEDGPDGLSAASRAALDAAEVVIGAARHLALMPGVRAEIVAWPVPFAEGLPVLLGLRGRRVVMLASGDPFWFGAGTSVAKMLSPGDWVARSGVSVFSLAASRMGWALEDLVCLGLHAAPQARVRPHLADGVRVIVLLRDGAAVGDLARYLVGEGCGASRMTVLEDLPGTDGVGRAGNGPTYFRGRVLGGKS